VVDALRDPYRRELGQLGTTALADSQEMLGVMQAAASITRGQGQCCAPTVADIPGGVAISFAFRGSLNCMGKLIYGFNVSLDGYIADAQGNIDWSEPSEELHQSWNDFERETALAFYGRRLYELMSAYWPTADQAPDATPIIIDFARIWRDMPKVVFSRTLQSVDWNSRLERGDPVEVVRRLKAETEGHLEVAGATLAAPIVQAGLVDEFRIVIAPTAVGGGTPFFPSLPSWISLRLLENRTFPGGTVLLRYEAKRD
jgi:dihydrofolate reductase